LCATRRRRNDGGVGNKPQIIVLWIFSTSRENNVGCRRSIGISFLPLSLCRRFKLALCKCDRVRLPSHCLIQHACDSEQWRTDEWTIILSLPPFYPSSLESLAVKRSEEKWLVTIRSHDLPNETRNPVKYARRKRAGTACVFVFFFQI